MLVVSHFTVPEADSAEFLDRARVALAAFAGRPGYRGGRVGRGVDDPAVWVLTTEWTGIGDYRRALSAYEVRMQGPLLAMAGPASGAFEVLAADGAGAPSVHPSERAADADSVGVGDAATAYVPRSAAPLPPR